MSNMDTYMNRILPMVGNEFRNKRIAFYDLNETHRIAEGFARSGARNFLFYDESEYYPGCTAYMSYGEVPTTHLSTGEAMEFIIRAHNHYEQNWNIIQAPGGSKDFAAYLETFKADLVVGSGSIADCAMLAELSRKLGVKAVLYCCYIPGSVNSVFSVLDPANGLDWSLFDDLPMPLYGRLANSIDCLEASSFAGLLAKNIVLFGTRHEDGYLKHLLYTDKRNNILRGTKEWPWWTFFGSQRSRQRMYSMAACETTDRSRSKSVPDTERLMVIGCGTGSLLVEEALSRYRSLCLVDCKPFSVYNPVRQWVTTRDVESDMPKPYVLQDIIARRYDRGECRHNSFWRILDTDDHSIWALNLKISDSIDGSEFTFEAALDQYKPTVVIVGMGQARDDNFTVCRILRERNIKHIIPGIFPLATHYKHIVVDGDKGPCYGCFQGRLIIDTEGSVEFNEEQREMFYGFGDYDEGTQPATIFDTWPSSHAMLRLALQLSLAPEDREEWFSACLRENRGCFVGANSICLREEAGALYGTTYPGQVVTYSEEDIVGMSEISECPDCGRRVRVRETNIIPDEAPQPFFKPF